MRRKVIVLAVVFILSIVMTPRGGSNRETEIPSRAVSFKDVGSTSFDQTSAPTFISTADWNNDGYLDLLFNGFRLFKNSGPPNWDYSLQTSIFNGSTSGARNGVWADWDGDGDQDLYQGCNKGTADRFWENQGAPDFKFEDISNDVFGSWKNLHPNTGNAWGDLDKDGDLDIYVGNGEDWNDGNPIYYPDYFLRNENGMTFTEVSSSAGIDTGENFYSRGATWGDYNNDQWQDVYVSHYRIRENHLFENQHDGTFEEVGQERNCSGTYTNDWYYDTTAGSVYGQYWWGPNWGHTIGSGWADFNRDGNLDLWTSDFVHKYVGYIGNWYDIRGYVCDDANLYISNGAPYYEFTDFRNTSGIPKWPIGGSGVYQGDQTFSGVTIGDYDNDGWEDIYIPQVYGDLSYTTPHLYRNKGVVQDGSVPNGTTFEDVTSNLDIKGANTYANLWVDYDNDGDLDLVTGGADTWNSGEQKWENYRVRLYQNQGTGVNQWLKIKLNGTEKNPDAVGARVIFRYNMSEEPQLIMREVRAGTGHAHQESSVLHFGLGDQPLTDSFEFHRLEVHWPDGIVQIIPESEYYQLNKMVFIDHPAGSPPSINNVLITPMQVYEDNAVTIQIDAVMGSNYISAYEWDLDADNLPDHYSSPTDPSIILPYYHGGLKHLRCTVWDDDGLGTLIYPIEIDVVNLAPDIELGDFVIEMDSNFILPINAISDSPSDRINLSWSVDWGDGFFTLGLGGLNASHSYTVPGEFKLKVSASDEMYTSTKEVSIKVVNIIPWGWVEPTNGNDSIFTEDEIVSFTPLVFDSGSDDGDRYFRWDFGDGAIQSSWTKDEIAYHRYEKSGNFNIKAHVKDQYNGVGVLEGMVNITNVAPLISLRHVGDKYRNVKEDEPIEIVGINTFDLEDTSSDLPLLHFKWDLGDGNVSDWSYSSNMNHIYEMSGDYVTTCTVRDDDLMTDTVQIFINVENEDPWIEDEDISQILDAYEDEMIEVLVDGRDTSSDRDTLRYEMEFPDGKILHNYNGTFRFSIQLSGYYDLTIRVIDDNGAFDEKVIYVNVLNHLPRGSISIEKNSYDEDEEVTLRAVDIWDTPSDLPNVTISWDMDDGSSIKSGSIIDHIFTKKGRFTVQMILDDGDDQFIEETDIIISNPTPVAAASIIGGIHIFKTTDVNINFSANGSKDNPSDMPGLIYLWDFGDGVQEEGMLVNHMYGEPGNYTVMLQVIDDDGAIGESVVQIKFLVDPTSTQDDNDTGINTILLILILFGGILFIILLILGGLILVKRRQMPSQHPPIPPQRTTIPAQWPNQQSSFISSPPPEPSSDPSLSSTPRSPGS